MIGQGCRDRALVGKTITGSARVGKTMVRKAIVDRKQ